MSSRNDSNKVDSTPGKAEISERLRRTNSLSLDKIIENEIASLEKDPVLGKARHQDLRLLRDHWNSFCTTYKALKKFKAQRRSENTARADSNTAEQKPKTARQDDRTKTPQRSTRPAKPTSTNADTTAKKTGRNAA